MPAPRTVGLTGGLATGKSTVAVLLARRGAEVLDADAVVHDLYRPGGDGARAVAEAFGPDALAADGSVDRSVLSRLATRDQETLSRLGQLVHPLVRREVRSWLGDLDRRVSPPPMAVVEAALLVETGGFRDYDLLVVVWCPRDQQLARAMARGVPEARARALLAAQASEDVVRQAADILIDNSGTRAELVAEVDRAWHEILAR